MENISIYSPEGVLLHEAPMSRQNRIANQLMGEHYIEIAFNVASSIPFVAGSYIVYNRWHYFLKKDAYPEPISGVVGYKYVLKFYAPQHRMEQRLMKWLASPNKEVTFKLTTTLDTFAQLLVDNMNAKIADEAAEFRWTYTPSYRNDTREVSFDGASCWEAMVRIAEAFGVEYWLTDINKPGMEGVVSVNELQLNFGKLTIGSNWEEIRESEVVTCLPASKRGVDANYGTRYYIYGSTKNIPEDYYESAEGGVTNHISEKRLHLPDGKPYIDVLNGNVVDSLPVGRVIERVIILEDVFPRNTSTITVIEEREEEIIEGRQDKSYTIVATDTGFDGSDDNVLGTLGVTFTSGALSGSSFDVRWNKPFDNRFHITPRVEGSTGSDQIVIPNDYIKPVVGDTFVLTGIKLPENKIEDAENELLSKGIAKAKEYGADTNVYECKTDPVYCQKNNKNYRLGTRVKLLGGAFGEEGRLSRIQGYEKALYNEYDATYSVGDNAIYSRIAAIAKGYANDSGRVVREESTKWQNKMNVTIQSTAGNAGIANKVNVLIGDDVWMSARDIAEDVLETGTTSFAKDLTGVLEATPEEFTFRPSAGDKSIRDESAVIRRIKGNTIVWGQLADITKVRTTGAPYIMETGDGWFSIQKDLSNPDTSYCYVNMDKQYAIPSHIYLLSQEIEVSGIETSDDYCFAVAYDFTPSSGVYYRQNGKNLFAKILTKLDTTAFQFFYYAYGKAKLKASNLQCFDLTSLFGAGNEPATYEEFKAIYPDIYPYCEPEIRNMRATAIETVGFNLYDGNYAKLIGGKTYYIGGTDIGTLTFTPNGTTASEVIELGDDRAYTPISSGKLSSTGADICVHFQHSGIKDGECADYVEHMLDIPEIAKYFPDGMNGIGKVYDEINSENAVMRFGRVDLGTLAWEESSHKGLYGVTISNGKEQKKVNVITHKYPYGGDKLGVADTSFEDKSLFNYYNTTNLQNALRIYIKDTTYSDVNAFKAAMSGVYLYYELAEPIVMPIIEPIQLAYDVEDFGTERAISPEDSAPFRADIVYQFNAEGRIRDNGRNIDKLELQVNTLDVVTKSIASHFDGEIVRADGLVDGEGNHFWLPSTRRIDKDKRLASEQFVIDNIPTEAATATPLQSFSYISEIGSMAPNVMYECAKGLGDTLSFELPPLNQPSSGYDHSWMIRFPSIENSNILTYPYTIKWKDGTRPTFVTSCTLEIYLKKTGTGEIIGEWKIYR